MYKILKEWIKIIIILQKKCVQSRKKKKAPSPQGHQTSGQGVNTHLSVGTRTAPAFASWLLHATELKPCERDCRPHITDKGQKLKLACAHTFVALSLVSMEVGVSHSLKLPQLWWYPLMTSEESQGTEKKITLCAQWNLSGLLPNFLC